MENKETMLANALSTINQACKDYLNEDIDISDLKTAILNLPKELWLDDNYSYSLVSALLKNYDLYGISLEEDLFYTDFLCDLIPKEFWSDPDRAIKTLDIIISSLPEICEYASVSDCEFVIKRFPSEYWQNKNIVLSILRVIIDNARIIDDLNCIDKFVQSDFFEDIDNLKYIVLSICNANEQNATDFWLFPSASWENKETVFMILSNLQDQLESNSYLFTMHPTFSSNKRQYIEYMLDYTHEKFKDDKEFILEFLEYNYFSDEFDVLYDWMNKDLWHDKEVVMTAIEKDCTIVQYIPNEFSTDEDVKNYIYENIDMEWDLFSVPEDKIPKWIKELIN